MLKIAALAVGGYTAAAVLSIILLRTGTVRFYRVVERRSDALRIQLSACAAILSFRAWVLIDAASILAVETMDYREMPRMRRLMGAEIPGLRIGLFKDNAQRWFCLARRTEEPVTVVLRSDGPNLAATMADDARNTIARSSADLA